jgi:hypothetical protein
VPYIGGPATPAAVRRHRISKRRARRGWARLVCHKFITVNRISEKPYVPVQMEHTQ